MRPLLAPVRHTGGWAQCVALSIPYRAALVKGNMGAEFGVGCCPRRRERATMAAAHRATPAWIAAYGQPP